METEVLCSLVLRSSDVAKTVLQVKGKKEEVDKRRGGKTISRSGQRWTVSPIRAGGDRNRWKGIVVMSSVCPNNLARLWDRLD